MKKPKLLAVLAVAMALAMLFASCTQAPAATTASTTNDATNTPATTVEAATAAATPSAVPALPSEISMFNGNPLTATTPAWDTPVGKKIQELTGVKLNVEYLVGQDIMTKANLMVAGGVYPDLIYAGDNVGIFIAANALIPLDDLIDKYGENIKKIYRPSELKLSGLQNGKIYVLSNNRPTLDNLYPAAGYYLGYAVLKDAGFPVVKTISQYSKLIKDYMAKNPTYDGQPTIGFVVPTEGSRVSALQYGGARFLGGYPNDGVTCVDQETLVAKINMSQPFTKEYLKFMNEMWTLGYMDKETFMQKDDQYKAKISSGRVIGLYDQRWAISEALAALEKTGKTDRNLVAFPVTLDNVQKEYYRGPYAFVAQGVSISSTCKDPEGVFRFLDRLCADDIQKLVTWGIEGEDYTLSGGKFTRTVEQWEKSFDVDYQKQQGIGQFTFLVRREQTDNEQYAKFEDGNWVNPAMNPEYNDLRYKDYEKQILKNYNIKSLCDFFAPAYPARYQPGWAVRQQMPQDTPEFISVTKALETSTEWHAKLVQAKPEDFDKLWDEYQAKLTAIPGLAEYETKATQIIQDGAQYYK